MIFGPDPQPALREGDGSGMEHKMPWVASWLLPQSSVSELRAFGELAKDPTVRTMSGAPPSLSGRVLESGVGSWSGDSEKPGIGNSGLELGFCTRVVGLVGISAQERVPMVKACTPGRARRAKST